MTAEARSQGITEVHELLAAGDGARRLPLYIGRAKDGELCFGSTGAFQCSHPHDRRLVYSMVAYGGKSPGPIFAGERSWGAVVGLADPAVERVLIVRQDGNIEAPALQRWPGFPWRAFASSVTGPNGHLPDALTYQSIGGRKAPELALSFAAYPCTDNPNACPVSGVWKNIADPVAAQQGPFGRIDPARSIAAADPLVQSLLRNRLYSEGPNSAWYACNGNWIGAVLHFDFLEPLAIDAELPFLGRAPDRQYSEGRYQLRGEGFTEMDAYVDVHRGKVVAIDPYTEGSVTQVHSRVTHKLQPAGSPDSGDCWQASD